MSETKPESICKDPASDLPGGCVVEGEVRIISYISPEGDDMFAYARSPDMSTPQVVSLLDIVHTIVTHDLVHQYMEQDEADDDDTIE